jgi:hypothetical protein
MPGEPLRWAATPTAHPPPRLLAEVEALAAERFRAAVTLALEADHELADALAERRVDPYGAAAALARRASA